MRQVSIIPDFINSEEIELLDENNVQMQICIPSQFKFNPNLFIHPFLLIDNFEKRKYHSIEIKKIPLEQIEKYGLRLVSVKATSITRNHPRQSRSYMLERKGNPIPNSEILSKLPKEHFIEMDIENKRIRVKGKNSFPYSRTENASQWISVGGVNGNK